MVIGRLTTHILLTPYQYEPLGLDTGKPTNTTLQPISVIVSMADYRKV